jgi:hypothetical protein
MDNNTALAFNTICNFIRDLSASFGSKQKSLLLYGHLIEKTGLIHIDPVKKHINIFKKYIEENQEAIEDRDKSKFKTLTISYSDKVAIDLKGIFTLCDKEEEKVIWNHLLTISAVLNPLGNAKQILKDMTASKKGGGGADINEDNFLKNIMDKIGSEVENYDTDNMNPMQMIGSMMSSGALNDIFQSISSGLNEGNLDLGSMMNSMQSLVSNINTMVSENQPATTAPATETSVANTNLLQDKTGPEV